MSSVYSRSRYFILSTIFIALFSLLGCGSTGSSSKSGSTQSHQPSDTPFSVRGDWAIMNGEITSRIVEQLNKLMQNHPEVKTIVMA